MTHCLTFYRSIQPNQTFHNVSMMDWSCPVLGLLVLSLLMVEANDIPPICIVGGGLTGISLALRLQEWGHRILLFEQKRVLGGKAETFEYRPGGSKAAWLMEKGPFLYSPYTSPLLDILLKSHGLPVAPYHVGEPGLFDVKGGGGVHTSPRFPQVPMLAAIRRYEVLKNSYALPNVLTSKPHPELLGSVHDWLLQNNLTLLFPLTLSLLTAKGYGDLRDIPALYMLSGLHPKEMEAALLVEERDGTEPFHYSMTLGWGELVKRMSASIPTKLVNHRLIQIKKVAEDIQELRFVLVGSQDPADFVCSKVLLTFPPTWENLAGMMMGNQTLDEKRILSEVKVNKVVSSGLTFRPPHGHDRNLFLGIVEEKSGTKGLPFMFAYPHGDGDPVMFTKPGGSSVNMAYAYVVESWLYGDYSTGPNSRDFEVFNSRLLTFLSNLTPYPTKTLFQTGYEFFPHVSLSSVKKGFFSRFHKLQGLGGVYYASSLLHFESVEGTLEMVEEFVDTYFTPNSEE